jgi:hypothetical protein
MTFREKPRCSQEAGNVHIVPAGMRHRYFFARVIGRHFAGVGQPGVFGHGQGIQVCRISKGLLPAPLRRQSESFGRLVR